MMDSTNKMVLVSVLLVLGICIGLGLFAHSWLVGILAGASVALVFWGCAEGNSGNAGRFVLIAGAGIGLGLFGMWLSHMAGRWLWAPVWLLICLPLFVVAPELRRFAFARAFASFLGFGSLIFAFVAPGFLYRLFSVGSYAIPALKIDLWHVLLGAGLVLAALAIAQGRAWNRWRYVLLSLSAVAALAAATITSEKGGSWWWLLPWLAAAGGIGLGARGMSHYSKGVGALGLLLSVISVLAAVLLPLGVLGSAGGAAAFQLSAPDIAFRLPNGDLAFVWLYLVTAFKSIWGIFHLLMILLIGEFWLRRWGGPIALLLLLAATWWIGGASQAVRAVWLVWVSSSPASWMVSALESSIHAFGSPGVGILIAGLVLAVLIAPAARISLQVTQSVQEANKLNQFLGSTAALRYLTGKNVSSFRTSAAIVVNLIASTGIGISLWVALREVVRLFNTSKLSFLFLPNLSVPSWKPVWHWSYFVLGAILWLVLLITQSIQKRYMTIQQVQGCQPWLLYAVGAFVSVLFVPAGVLIFSIIQSMAQWLVVPLSRLGQQQKGIPSSEPVLPPSMPIPPEPGPEVTPHGEPTPPPFVVPAPLPVPQRIVPLKVWDVLIESDAAIIGFALRGETELFLLDANGRVSFFENASQKASLQLALPEPGGLVSAGDDGILAVGKTGSIILLKSEDDSLSVSRSETVSIPIPTHAINPFGSMLACADGAAGKVHGLFLADLKVRLLTDKVAAPGAMAFSRDGRYLAIGCADGSVPILDIATRRALQVLKPPRAGSQPGAALHIAAGSRDGQDCWVTTHAGNLLSQWSGSGELLGQAGLEGRPTCLAVHAERGAIAVGDEQGRVRLFSSTLEPLSVEQAHAGSVLQLAFLQGDRSLVSAGDDKMLKTNGI